MKLWCAMLLVLGLQAQAEQPAFAEVPLPDTQVIELPDPSSGRQYQLWLDLPASYQHDQDKVFAFHFGFKSPYGRFKPSGGCA